MQTYVAHKICVKINIHYVTTIAKYRFDFLNCLMWTNYELLNVLALAHALGGVSGVASFITTDEQLQ